VTNEIAGDDARYWAFISYSHRDAAFGRRLHRRLENYALPRRLVGRETAQGAVPKKPAPIFRDREELPAAHDLSTEVRAALKASRSLIVVCSPSAAASQWVGREIEVFRELHPERPILVAVRDGEPKDCFPQALHSVGPDGTAIEPLAADFRRGRDGEQLGLLKLVAGIIGLGLDELIQRDAHRRNQRVTAVTAAALAGMIVMGVLTGYALNARSEADRQRAEAEGLVEYMLTDLRDRLKGVGRLDVMTAVNERALKYYGDQDIAHLPADSLERRGRILREMGEDDEQRGNLDAASGQFLEARRTTATLLAESPNDAARIFDHAQNVYWVALIEWRRFHFDAAQAGFEQYAALANRLLSKDAKNPDWQMEGGYADSNLATLILNNRSDPKLALIHFSRAQDLFNRAHRARPADPDIMNQIADGHGWLAECQRGLGLFDQAWENRLLEKRLLHELLKQDTRNAVYMRDLLGNALGFAQIDLDRGRIEAAEARLSSTYGEALRLAVLDPSDLSLAKRKIVIGLFLASAQLRREPPPISGIRGLLADCATPVARNDTEIADFCAILSTFAAAKTGIEDRPASNYVQRNHSRMMLVRHSPRWGIDFAAELNRGTRK
jgi:hypothetical protein